MIFFQNGVSKDFGQKMANFPTIFFRQYRPEIYFYAILEEKNAFLGYKARSSKSRKIAISPKG